jgi:hypothetical protein
VSSRLYNTRTPAKQTFVAADPSGRVGLFACSPTVDDVSHLGHAKAHIQFDFLARLPRTRDFAVTYVQNITDVDDKIIRRARELRIDASELARVYERASLDDMRALRNDSVVVYARAGDYIDQVISQIERLQQAGATPSGRAARRATGRDRSSVGRFDEDELAAAEPLRDRACPVDLGVRIGARVVDALDVDAGHLHHAASA